MSKTVPRMNLMAENTLGDVYLYTKKNKMTTTVILPLTDTFSISGKGLIYSLQPNRKFLIDLNGFWCPLWGQILGSYRNTDFTAVKLMGIRQECSPRPTTPTRGVMRYTAWKKSLAVLSITYSNEYYITGTNFQHWPDEQETRPWLTDDSWGTGKKALPLRAVVKEKERTLPKGWDTLSDLCSTLESNQEVPVFPLKIWKAGLPSYWS